jgi:hypothetical protein
VIAQEVNGFVEVLPAVQVEQDVLPTNEAYLPLTQNEHAEATSLFVDLPTIQA